MKTVRDVMCPVLDVLHTTDSVADAADYLASHEEESVPFCLADGRLAGLVFAEEATGGQGLAIPPSRLRPLLESFAARGVPIAPLDVGDPAAVRTRSSPCG